MEEKIRQVLIESARLAVSVDTLNINSDLYTAGLSSLATVQVMLGIEEAFDVEIPDNLLERNTFRSIAELMRVVKNLTEA